MIYPQPTERDASSPPGGLSDPIAASFRLYSLIETHDRTLEQVLVLDSYILSITTRIIRDAETKGHVPHGMLLLSRKCVAEGMRDVFVRLASRKWEQVRACYDYILQRFDASDERFADLDDDDISEDHEVENIARGLTSEYCATNRQC